MHRFASCVWTDHWANSHYRRGAGKEIPERGELWGGVRAQCREAWDPGKATLVPRPPDQLPPVLGGPDQVQSTVVWGQFRMGPKRTAARTGTPFLPPLEVMPSNRHTSIRAAFFTLGVQQHSEEAPTTISGGCLEEEARGEENPESPVLSPPVFTHSLPPQSSYASQTANCCGPH